MIRLQKVALVFKKDWLEIRRNWQVLLPLICVPIVFAVVLPEVAVMPTLSIPSQASSEGLLVIMKALPAHIRYEIVGMTGQQAIAYMMLLYLFAPVFLIIPIIVSGVIASDSFAGEKERKTIEALLATSLSDAEMLFGKILVAFVPAVTVTAVAFAIYSAVVDYMTFGLFGRFLLPNMVWLSLIFGLAPAVAFADIGLTVIVSARVRGVREAQQISALLLVPLFGVVLGQASGSLFFDPILITALTSLFIVLDTIILGASIRAFGRDRILARLV
jgi:ABC-2 type transport system permease protein